MSGDFDPFIVAEVGDLVRHHRRAKGFTTRGFCKAVGIRPSTLWNIEIGKTGPSLTMLYRIARTLGVRPHELLPEFGQTDMRRERAMRQLETNDQHGAVTGA